MGWALPAAEVSDCQKQPSNSGMRLRESGCRVHLAPGAMPRARSFRRTGDRGGGTAGFGAMQEWLADPP